MSLGQHTSRHKRWIRQRARDRGMDADLSADLNVLNSVASGLSRAAAEPTSNTQPRSQKGREKSVRTR
jgi:hypothetical protein